MERKRHEVIRQIEHTVELPRLETTYKFHRTLLAGLSIRGERFPLRTVTYQRRVNSADLLSRLLHLVFSSHADLGKASGEANRREGETVCAVLCSDSR